MGFLGNGKDSSSPEDEAIERLFALDEDESEDLALHSRRCSHRWAVMIRLQRSQQREMQAAVTQIRYTLFGIAALLVVNLSPALAGIAEKLIGFFF